MGPSSARQALAQLPLFATLDEREELADLLALARPFQAAAGSVLFSQGEPADGMYVLTEGEVEIRARVPGDTRRTLVRLGAGAMVGEMGLIDRGPRSADAQAHTRVAGWFLSEQLFRALRMARRPSARKVMERVCLALCERIRARAADVARVRPPTASPWDPDAGLPASRPPPALPDALPPAWLERLPFFAGISAADRTALLACGKLVAAPRGQRLWDEGDPPRRCYVPVRGALRLTVDVSGGLEPCLVLGPGRLAGGVALLDGLPQPTSCEVRESGWLFEAESEQLRRVATGTSSLSLELFEAVAASLVDQLRLLTRTVARLSAQGRIQRQR